MTRGTRATGAAAAGGAAQAGPLTRAQAIGAAALSGAAIGGGALLARALGLGAPDAGAQGGDADALNFLLLVEYVEEGFYAEAVERGRLSGELRRFAETVGAQEREHVAVLRRRLGSRALGRPELDFGRLVDSPEAFQAAAIKLEEAGASAYIAEGPKLTSEAMLDAARIVAVEARHTAWIRDIAGENPAPNAADPPGSAVAVLATLRREGLIE